MEGHEMIDAPRKEGKRAGADRSERLGANIGRRNTRRQHRQSGSRKRQTRNRKGDLGAGRSFIGPVALLGGRELGQERAGDLTRLLSRRACRGIVAEAAAGELSIISSARVVRRGG